MKEKFRALLRHLFIGKTQSYSGDEADLSALVSVSQARQRAFDRGVNARSVRLLYFVFLALLVFFFWAFFAELDVIVRGMGQVVPSSRVQHIQNLEGGILREIMVKEGQEVEEGALLARIDNESAGSQYREAIVRSLEHQASIARLTALIENKEPVFPKEVLDEAELAQRHRAIWEAMRQEFSSELHVLDLQADARKREAAEQEARKKELEASLKIAQKQRAIAQKALQSNAYSTIDFLNLEQQVQNLKTDITALEHSIPRLYVEAEEMQERVARQRAERMAQYNQEIGETQAKLRSLQELLIAGSDKVARTEMRSPVTGLIKNIYVSTIGGVLSPGATLMDIVPTDDSLIIEARFSPADIAFLYPGLPATVRLSAYDFAVYGSVSATVEQIGADTVEGSRGELFYNVKVRTQNTIFNKQGEVLPILAGMQAEVDIVTGKKTVMDYILKPLLRVRDRAFRES